MDYYALEQSYETLMQTLLSRREMLEKLVDDFRKNQLSEPAGYLRVSRKGCYFQYYWRESLSESWKYLPREKLGKARELAAGEYRDAIVEAAERELAEIKRLLVRVRPMSLNEVFASMRPGRRALVEPLVTPDEEIMREFYDNSYPPLDLYENRQFQTTQGEYVRSKAEWMIAEILQSSGVPYQYEAPLTLRNGNTFRPDFRCLNLRKRKVIYWEHLGMMGDTEYAASVIRKMQIYEENGYFIGDNLIVTEECSLCPLKPETVVNRVQKFLM
jgi:hypothetical protein